MSEKRLRRLASFSEYQVEHSASHELPYWEMFEDLVVLADGSLVVGMKLRGIALETLVAADINQITLSLRALLSGLPDGLEMGLISECNTDFKEVFNRHAELAKENPLAQWMTQVRLNKLDQEARENRLLTTNLYLFLYQRYARPKNPTRLGLFSPPTKFTEVKRAHHEEATKTLMQLSTNIRSQLESISIVTKSMKQDEIISLIYRFLNPSRCQTEPPPQLKTGYRNQEFTPQELSQVPALALSSPRDQLLFSDFVLGFDSFYSDSYYHRAITLKTLPEYTHSALISRMMNLPFPHLLHVHIRVPEQSKELSSLQAKRRMAHSMSLSHGGRVTDLESEAKLQSTEDLLRELIHTGQKIFYFQMSILLRAKAKDEIERQTKSVLSQMREMGGAEGMGETVAGFKTWKTLLPLGNLSMVRPKRIKTDNLADFIPVFQPYDGPNLDTSKPVCLFRNRSQGIIHYDPFDKNLPNYNKLVTGTSGAGKSFINNLVLLQYISQNPRVYIIDIGGSYRKLTEFLDGQYVEITPPENDAAVVPINPFHLTDRMRTPSPQKLKFLVGLLQTMLTEEEGNKLPKLEKSLLEAAIVDAYAKASSPTLSTLCTVLAASQDSALKNFSRMLYPWTGDRPYGRLLDAPNALDLKKRFVTFDLKGLSNYPDLQSVMILIITDFIITQVEGNRQDRKQILMDECWQLLKSHGSREVMEYCVRTLRKTGSGITFITQGLEEIIASPIGPAILSNTATKFILMQRGDLETVRKALKLNEQELSLVSSLKQSKGLFSEAFLIAGDAKSVIRVCPTPVEYWLATSDAADNQMLEEERGKDLKKSLAMHIRDLAIRYPYGAAHGGIK